MSIAVIQNYPPIYTVLGQPPSHHHAKPAHPVRRVFTYLSKMRLAMAATQRNDFRSRIRTPYQGAMALLAAIVKLAHDDAQGKAIKSYHRAAQTRIVADAQDYLSNRTGLYNHHLTWLGIDLETIEKHKAATSK